jgi:hypothetical protein
VTPVTDVIAVREYWAECWVFPTEEGVLMSSVHLSEATTHRADPKHRDYGFVLVLACMVLGLVVASAIFKPAPVAAGTDDQVWFVGP